MKEENCNRCKDSGKIRMPKDQKAFDDFVDREMDKAYFVDILEAKERAYKKIGFTYVDCPECQK